MTQPLPASSLAAARLSADSRVAQLRALLLDPLGVPGDAELVVVPVGHLHGIPWSALWDAPVSLAPSGVTTRLTCGLVQFSAFTTALIVLGLLRSYMAPEWWA